MNLETANLWFPKYARQEPNDFVIDVSQSDFEMQTSLFDQSNVVHRQLTPGIFQGRVLCAMVGRVSIFMEFSSQAIEKQFSTPQDLFSFCLVLNDTKQFVTNGKLKSKDMLCVTPPGGETTIVAPPDAITLAFAVDRDALLASLVLEPQLADWLMGLGRNGVLIRSVNLVQTLRDRMFAALEIALGTRDPERRAVIDDIALTGIASALTLEWLKINGLSTVDRARGFQRFERARTMLINDSGLMDRVRAGLTRELGSQRSLEKAFSDFAFLGPMAYLRVVRLHNARHKLLDPERADESIGDIAAEESFWDWSRFTSYYRKQFGELPSQTRQRAFEGKAPPARRSLTSGVV
ncbi:helix-turn-helix domain-containing protein [Hoeflea prorocentri]|uniref:Helix-turn-helix domain-containing protein n=2 Tax=Hoeflea prorocentri TaxID=1922333 RepID=A0A9X3UKD5_9HYPH|nr:AraC family transcriptional regulator [Hoeflea prorocentri]MDA5400248.1 helix-turn-helix domain-containing protein [Hoeflea prorocentri]